MWLIRKKKLLDARKLLFSPTCYKLGQIKQLFLPLYCIFSILYFLSILYLLSILYFLSLKKSKNSIFGSGVTYVAPLWLSVDVIGQEENAIWFSEKVRGKYRVSRKNVRENLCFLAKSQGNFVKKSV